MIQHAETCRWDVHATGEARPRDDDDQFLQIAVARCVRNAAGQRTPRNQFERLVSDRLRSAATGTGNRTSDVSQFVDELCQRIRDRFPHSDGNGGSP